MMGLSGALLMWGLVLVLLLRARKRPDNTMLLAAVVIAASMTTNITGVYLWAASWLPWPNGLDLVANVLLIVGVYSLASAIRRGSTATGVGGRLRADRTRTAAIVTVIAMACAFAFIDDPVPSPSFMLTYGDQPAAAAYSIVQYVYIFAVMLGTLVTCFRNVPQMMQARFKIGFSIIGAGCSTALLLCLSVIAMDLGNVVGAAEFVLGVGGVYNYLYLATMTFLCVGLGIPPLFRQVSAFALRRRVLAVEPEIRRIWNATVARNPSLSLVGTTLPGAPSARQLDTPRATEGMHRMVVEIHDFINVQGDGAETISPEDWEHLNEAESLCLHRGRMLNG